MLNLKEVTKQLRLMAAIFRTKFDIFSLLVRENYLSADMNMRHM